VEGDGAAWRERWNSLSDGGTESIDLLCSFRIRIAGTPSVGFLVDGEGEGRLRCCPAVKRRSVALQGHIGQDDLLLGGTGGGFQVTSYSAHPESKLNPASLDARELLVDADDLASSSSSS
jgi:hypothetical protein